MRHLVLPGVVVVWPMIAAWRRRIDLILLSNTFCPPPRLRSSKSSAQIHTRAVENILDSIPNSHQIPNSRHQVRTLQLFHGVPRTNRNKLVAPECHHSGKCRSRLSQATQPVVQLPSRFHPHRFPLVFEVKFHPVIDPIVFY